MEDYKNKFLNGDCIEVLSNMVSEGVKVDSVITSPPYNTARSGGYHMSEKALKNHEGRYDIHLDNKSDEEYIEWTIDLFNKLDLVLSKDGSICYNISYGGENSHLIWLTISAIIQHTNFTTADVIYWKKKSALPNNSSSNKVTRIVEPVFVFCRKEEYRTFRANKKVKSYSRTGQKYYENVFNYFEAKNNDGSNKLNKATYSSDMVMQLLDIYVQDNSIVLDPFMGTGTTALAVERYNEMNNYSCSYIGIELSPNQIDYSKERLKNYLDGK